jgi:hypothetical protein
MGRSAAFKRHSFPADARPSRIFTYPAVADRVGLPDLTFRKKRGESVPVPLFTTEKESFLKRNTRISDTVKELCDLKLTTLLALVWPEGAGPDITVNIIARRAAVLNIKHDGANVVVDAHWNLFIPYFYQIEELPIVHSEVLDMFAGAVFNYAATAIKHPEATRKELRSLVIDAYSDQPQFLLASLDIFNKPSIYHIHPARIWFTGFSTANDDRRLEIDDRASRDLPVSPDFLEEVAAFVHQVVKNYAFRYVDYLWTQRYRISCAEGTDMNIVDREGNEIVINIRPLMGRAGWKPALYLSLGYAIMLTILKSSGGGNNDENIYLAVKKTWDRYASLDEYPERQSVREFCGLPELTNRGHIRRLLQCMTGKEVSGLMDDFMIFMDYSGKETLAERLKALRESQHESGTGVDYEQLSDAVRNLKMTLRRNNIGYSKLIGVLRDDNIDHQQLADLLLTGCLHNRRVVDVNEWLLLRTLLYDLINAPKVFKNDYKMLLKVLTKVNKGLIIYIWTLILNNDERCELVNGYIAKLITDIFVFDRVKVYEIASEPVECLEAEAVTGYLLNWAGLSLEEWRSIVGGALSRMPRSAVARLSVRTASDVDQLIRAMTIRSSGLIGFYLHQAYRWGSTHDELTGRIRSYFPELLNLAQKAMVPGKTIFGGAMLLLILAQIISDQHDGFAGNVEISQAERQTVLNLIEQCVDWNQSHFVIMVGGIAAGYTGSIDGWTLQRFDTLLGRYGGGDRVVLRSVVQFDVEILIERTLITARAGEESALVNKIQLLRLMVDPVISNRANKFLADIAARHGIKAPEDTLKKREVREFVLDLSRRMKAKMSYIEEEAGP